jgi:hypothetical protein
MQPKLAISVFAVAAIVVAGAVFFLLPSAIQSSPNMASSSQSEATSLQGRSSCANASPISYSYPTPVSKIPVLLLQPGSTAVVCVTYEASWIRPNVNYTNIQSAFFPNGTYGFPAPQITNTVGIENCTCTTDTVSHSFLIKAEPTSITPAINATTVTIMYTITPMSNATGFYDGFYPASGILIAVGHDQSQIAPSDFPYAGQDRPGGPIRAYYPMSVSMTGAGVTYISAGSATP